MRNFTIIWSLNTFRFSVVILLVNARLGIAEECGKLLVAEGTTVSRYGAELNNQEVLVESPFPISVEYDPTRDTVFWSDLNTREIKAFKDSDNQLVLANLQPDNWLPCDLAVDSVTNKLYVLDSATSTVHLFDLVQGSHAVMLGRNLTEPKKIELDPYEGYLFVLDKYEIFRIDTDGENRQLIFSEIENVGDLVRALPVLLNVDLDNLDQQTLNKPMTISDITLDFENKRIYWVDSLNRRIESSDYNGQNKKLHYHDATELVGFESFSSLAILDSHIYWADGLDKVRKIALHEEGKIEEFSKYIMSIKAMTCPNLKIDNPCEKDNGGCPHLCILSKNSKTNFRCACALGYKLDTDDNTCVPVHDYLLFTLEGYLRGQISNLKAKSFVDVLNPATFKVGKGATIDFDVKENKIYFSSLFPDDKIHQISLDNNEITQLVPDLISSNSGTFALDWITKNLYYFTYYYADMTTLSVMNVENPTYSRILINNVTDLVRGIVVHPNKGYLFFAQVNGNNDIISRMALDGSSLSVLINLDTAYALDGLALDDVENRLYWSESVKQEDNTWSVKIRHSNIDGQNVKDLNVPSNLGRVNSIIIHGDSIYVITESPNNAMVWLSKSDPSVSATTLMEVGPEGSLSGLKVFARNSQRVEPGNPCTHNNDCQKFCFVLPSANGNVQYTCACSYGEKLAEDGKSCVDNQREEPPLIPCKSASYRCNKRTKVSQVYSS